MEIYAKQLQSMQNVDKILMASNNLSANEYAQYMRLMNLFVKHISSLKDEAVYIKDSFKDVKPKDIQDKAIVVVKNRVYFVNNNRFQRDAYANYLSIKLTRQENNQLHDLERSSTGMIIRTPANTEFLDALVENSAYRAKLALKPKIDKFRENKLKITPVRGLLRH